MRRIQVVVMAGAALALAVAAAWLVSARVAYAHCDTLTGPVVMDAKAALEKGDITPVLKWVDKDHEEDIKAAFRKTLAVRTGGPEAKDLADMYFFETLVRLHRAGEGAPYTGLKDASPEEIIAMADKALAGGSPDEMIRKMQAHLEAGVKQKFERALETRKHKDDSVEAGREFVEAYVAYTHYVEGIHVAIVSAGAHGEAAAGGGESAEHVH